MNQALNKEKIDRNIAILVVILFYHVPIFTIHSFLGANAVIFCLSNVLVRLFTEDICGNSDSRLLLTGPTFPLSCCGEK